MEVYKSLELQIIEQSMPLSSSGYPAMVGDLMRGRQRPPDLKLISYQDGGGPDTEDCLHEEGAATSFLIVLLTHLNLVVNFIVTLNRKKVIIF